VESRSQGKTSRFFGDTEEDDDADAGWLTRSGVGLACDVGPQSGADWVVAPGGSGKWADPTDLVQRVYETFSIYFSILNSNLNQI
jgi:hypothetical protein